MNTNQKTIALVIPSLKSGGMERVMSELANHFAEYENHVVHIVMYGKTPKLFYNLDKRIMVHTSKEVFSANFRLLFTLQRLIYLRRTIKEINPNTVLSFGTLWNSFVLLALKGLKYPVYISDRGNPTLKYSFFQEYLRDKLYKSASGIITQTTLAMDIVKKRFPNCKVTVIGNPIRPIGEEHSQIKKEKIVLSVSPLKATKHQDRLVNIFSKINAPGWKLVIVGGNALNQKNFEKLSQQVIEQNLSDRVLLAGEQKNVDEYYLKSSIFAFTSSTEGFPNVVGEALSSGLPVISYDCITGPSEMINDAQNGFLVPVFDDETFHERLQRLINKEDMRLEMSKKAKEKMLDFTIETIGQKFYSFITSY
jgi:GalNAc-alpha-(1->4)-GalNAc-alpha-(1->3)-diNAcBac-PP-undecaprenol alpha-1,4-N-acetyl-D-galactosaminyltransferase